MNSPLAMGRIGVMTNKDKIRWLKQYKMLERQVMYRERGKTKREKKN